MSLQRQMTFWIGALVVLVLLLWLLSSVMLPFIAGLVVAYFLDPVADRLERLGMPRWGATSVIMLAFILAIVLALVLILPILGSQLAGLQGNLPGYAASLQRILADLNNGMLGGLIGDHLPELQKALADSIGQGASLFASFLASIWSGSKALLSLVSVLVITPVVAFYILLDWDVMTARVDSWLPRDHATTIRGIAAEINTAIAGFVRGQATVCLLLGIFYGLGLTFADLSFGLLIGLCTGLAAFVPYVGAILGFAVAMTVALVQSWPDWQLPLVVAIIYAIGQFLEGNILSPRLVGSSVGLHPVWLIFALLSAGALFGFVGLLVAVPVAAAIGVLVRFALRQYLASPLYTGQHYGQVTGTDETSC
jgi:predicted PurR-regulated permease PerM